MLGNRLEWRCCLIKIRKKTVLIRNLTASEKTRAHDYALLTDNITKNYIVEGMNQSTQFRSIK